MKRFWIALVCLAFVGALLAGAGCSTWAGAGEDLGKVGDSMESADD